MHASRTWIAALTLLVIASSGTAREVWKHEDAEARYEPPYAHMATGDLAAFRARTSERYSWPFPLLSIGHTIASYQRYGFGGAYFHHGLDIRGDDGTEVRAAVGGKVVNVGNYNGGSRYYWEVAILDPEGFLWQYHHVDFESIPQIVKDAFENQTDVPTGTVLGEIIDWPADSFGETYHHVHLNVLGQGAIYQNPFDFLDGLADTSAPEIQAIGLLDASRRPVGGDQIGGDYSLSLRVRDLILHTQFFVPPHHIEIEVDDVEPVTVWTFDSLPGKTSRTKHIDEFYVERETCGNYSCRKSTIDLGFTPEGKRPFPDDVGGHTVRVRVKDYAGNSAEQTYAWTVVPTRPGHSE